MEFLLFLWTRPPNINLPSSILDWLGLIFGLIILGLGIRNVWLIAPKRLNGRWTLLIVLLVSAPICASCLGINFHLGGNPTRPDQFGLPPTSTTMFLADIPWVLAAGILGPVPAIGIALLTGLVRSLEETHSLFTIIEFGLISLIFAWSVTQSYRPKFFAFLRRPSGAFLLSIILYIPILSFFSLFSTNGLWVEKINFALTQTYPWVISRGLELLIAVIPAEFMFFSSHSGWTRIKNIKASIIETSIAARFNAISIPLVLFFFLGLAAGDWLIARSSAVQVFQEKKP